MKRYIYILIVSLISLSQAKADEIPMDKDSIIMSYTADEIVIQSFKRNDNMSQLPISASLLSDKTIKDRNITNIKEISAFIPNLFIPDYGSKMTSPVYIRGIGSSKNAPSVGLYVDGTPYFDRSSFDINMNDIDRIEVLRGPQGTIYGRNTMGGIINVYTKSPFKYKETNVGISAGNHNTYQVNASHYGNVKNTFGYAVTGNYLHTGGYFNNVTTHKKADPMDAVSGRIRLSWHVRPELYIHLTSAYEYSDQDGYPYRKYDDNHFIHPINYNAHSYYRRNMSTTGLNLQYSTDKIRFNSQSSFQYFDGRQGLDQDFTPKDEFYVIFDQYQRMWSQEFNLKSLGNKNYEWLFGAFGFYQDYGTNNNIEYIAPEYRGLRTFQNITTPSSGIALFHQSTFNNILTKGLSATLGLRYDWEEIKADVNIYSEDNSGGPKNVTDRNLKDTYSQLTPKATLQYTFTNDELVYASITKGFKAGGFNNTAEDESDLAFKPEQSWSYEIGTKASCFDKLIYTDLSLFYIRWNDQQVSQYQPSGRGFIVHNAGKSISKGVEATIHINPLENLSINIGYGYTHATFKKYITERDLINTSTGEITHETTDYSGKYLPMVPRHTFSAAANYTIKLKGQKLLDKIILNGQYTGAGRLYWREDNNASQAFYGTLNAQTSFVKDNITLDLWAKNITEKQYISYFFASKDGNFVQLCKPFTCGVNINIKF
jgi:iron complex outermembrane receptor protein